jgi:hypothetical protein
VAFEKEYMNEFLQTDVPWDDASVVSAGKLRKLRDSLSELRSSLCERRLERTVVRPALLPVKTAQFTQFFPSSMTSHSKIAQFNWECIAPFKVLVPFSDRVCFPDGQQSAARKERCMYCTLHYDAIHCCQSRDHSIVIICRPAPVVMSPVPDV